MEKNSSLELIFSNNILLVQKQILKDFNPFDIHFPENFDKEIYAFEEILMLIENNLSQIMENQQKTLQLLYKIDISENLFFEIIQKPDLLTNLAHQILHREAQKVYYRLKFYKK